MAITNIKHVDVLLGVKEVLGIFVLFFFLIIPFFIKDNNRRVINVKIIAFVFLSLISLLLLPRYSTNFINYYQKVQAATQISRLSPLVSLYDLAKSYFISDESITVLHGKTIEPKPVDLNNFSLKINRKDKLNIIVFFVEGISSRLLNTYGGQYLNLTPNIDMFANNSIKVTNYFNHTAATYRGIHGQLCSIYPKFGGVGGWGDDKNRNKILNSKSSYECLPQIFDQKGYQTVYINPHYLHSSYFPELAKKVGFKEIFSAEESSKDFLNDAKGLNNEGLTDNQQLKAIENYLRKRKSSAPLFLATYTLETHAWVDVSKDGIKYGDGSNHTLNTLHNFDYAFGKFINYINNSKYKDNTIIVLTADHAHYYEDSYIKLMDKSYQKFFVDQIPLIIHYPNNEEPIEIDAHSSTSIDFAPSILQLSDIKSNAKFIGRPIFRENIDKLRLNISAIGTDPIDTFIVVDGKVYRNKFSTKYKNDLAIAAEIIENMRKNES
ncbi:LTA synthase family protein [Photobacterium leiognathi]|uniref:LTA synthase family protein n=1 Tax=Photobacterium leiognathi TaxID=553611 RepID=UPI00298219D0|nr:LTA synthase family protein [Photobacterium leiognathi]